jgi:hypothetical protein
MSTNDCNCGCPSPCFADDATACNHGPIRDEADPSVVTVCKDYQAVRGDKLIVVTRQGVTITMPKNPQPGDAVAIAAMGGGAVTVLGGCKPICGANPEEEENASIASCLTGILTFTTTCVWSRLNVTITNPT